MFWPLFCRPVGWRLGGITKSVITGVSLRALYVLGLAADGAGYTSPLGVQFKKLTVYRKNRKIRKFCQITYLFQ